MRSCGAERPGAAPRPGPPRPARPGLPPDQRKDPRRRLSGGAIFGALARQPGCFKNREEYVMAKYLITASYTAEGMRGLQKDKASGRRNAVREACESIGGKLEAFYFAFGED